MTYNVFGGTLNLAQPTICLFPSGSAGGTDVVQGTCGKNGPNPKQIATVLISFVSCTVGSLHHRKKVPEILSGGFQIITGQRSRSANQRREYKSGPIKDVHIMFGVDL